jgi:hypothetical protein
MPENTTFDQFIVTPTVLDLFVRALVNEVDYDIHKNYECNEENGEDVYPELVETAAEILAAIIAGQAEPETHPQREDGAS